MFNLPYYTRTYVLGLTVPFCVTLFPPARRSPAQELVHLFDVSRGGSIGGSMDSMSPVVTYTEHHEMVTCGAPWAASPHVFATGGKDPLIRVWDRRTPSCVGCFAALDSATGKVAVSSGSVRLSWTACF